MAWPGSARIKAPKRTRRALWVGFKPHGFGETRPNGYRAIFDAFRDNWRRLPYALRIMRKGVCDGCALGVAGYHDWTISGVHLCATRLALLKLNTMHALDPAALADVESLRAKSGGELRALGRLGHPMLRRRGEPGFRQVSWDEALDLLADRIRASTPDRLALYLTARGLTNETYYVAQKTMRFLGTNNIDNAARVCHAPSTVALRRTIGVAATTCSYTDVIASDLIVLFGANVANGQPVFMKYLYLARKHNAEVVVVNPLREPGLDRYWVPSSVESAVFGTKMADDFVPVHTGGDIAFINGALKVLIADDAVDHDFIREHTTGWDDLVAELERESFDDLVAQSGIEREQMESFARRYAAAPSAVLVWSMGITQHEHGADNVAAIVNLGLARGNVGRPGTGLMPIRGHSGVQGGAEMGAYATALPGGVAIDETNAAALSEQYGFEVSSTPGLSAPEMLDAGERGDLDVLWSSGGNFLEVLPDPGRVEQALERIPLRVHQDIVMSSQMLVDGEAVLLLPAATRYEQHGGGTETTTERRIAFSPEVRGPRAGEARSEWEIFVDVARRVDPERADLATFASGDDIRREVARVVPSYEGIETLERTGDSVQWGGTRLCEGGIFPTADGRGAFTVVAPPVSGVGAPAAPNTLRLSTRRGKQFNTIVLADRDPLTGAVRDSVFLSSTDAERHGVGDGDAIVVRSSHGEMRGRVFVTDIAPGNVQVMFPEGNVLLPSGPREPLSHVPDYTTIVELVPDNVPEDV